MCINQAILKALPELEAGGSPYRLKPGELLPFMAIPDPHDFPTYLDIITQPMCLNHIKTFARNGNFSSLL